MWGGFWELEEGGNRGQNSDKQPYGVTSYSSICVVGW